MKKIKIYIKYLKKIFNTILLILVSLYIPSSLMADEVLTFGVVPQQSASKLARLWTPILKHISQQSGLKLRFTTAKDITTFEKRLAAGEYDISYMNPYHYVVFSKTPGYRALSKARDKQIKGIIVAHKNSKISSLTELDNSTLAFPSPAAFAASILTRSDLESQNVKFKPKYVSSHDSVYHAVAKGFYPAGGGVLRTFRNMALEARSQLRILWTTKGYTPHAIAAHPRIDHRDIQKIQLALTNMDQNTDGKKLLHNIKIKGFENATDQNWDDVRKLNLNQLSDL